GARPRRGPHLKVGILGGTFDPVHSTHLALARAALDHLKLDRVLFIPTGSPHYRKPAIASGAHRVAMLELALRGEPRFGVDARELAAQATGYTVDTLRQMKTQSPKDELFLLMGGDQHSKFESWREPDEVARLAQLAVAARPGFEVKGRKAQVIPFQP